MSTVASRDMYVGPYTTTSRHTVCFGQPGLGDYYVPVRWLPDGRLVIESTFAAGRSTARHVATCADGRRVLAAHWDGDAGAEPGILIERPTGVHFNPAAAQAERDLPEIVHALSEVRVNPSIYW